MKKQMGIFIAVLISMLFGVFAFAADIAITSGSETGKYFKVGSKLVSMFKGTILMPSKGSVENLERISKNEAQIGFTQMDALAWFIDKNPAAQNEIEIVGPLYKECIFVAVPKNGPIKNEDDLQTNKGVIAIGEEGSGSTVTWEYMTKLEPGYKKSIVDFVGGLRALGKLASYDNNPKSVNAVMFVSAPDPGAKLISTVANNENLKFIDIDDSDLNDKFPMTGKPIYSFEKVTVKKGTLSDTKINTICVDAALIASKKLDSRSLDRLTDLSLNYKASLVQ